MKLLCDLAHNGDAEDECFTLEGMQSNENTGLFFYNTEDKQARAEERMKRFETFNDKERYSLFQYLWVIFSPDNTKGIGDPDNANLDTVKDLYTGNAMFDKDSVELARQWISSHKSLNKINNAMNKRKLTLKKFKDKNAASLGGQAFKNFTDDLGVLLYNIPAAQIESLFKIIPDDVAGSLQVKATRVNFLDYDSFSDIELDELAAELEPLDELDVDQLLDGYDSVSDVSIAGNTYDSESEQSIGYASAYNSESEQSLGYASAYNSESEQSLAYGADYNSESEFSDGYGAYNSESEHSTSYDSESDLDR